MNDREIAGRFNRTAGLRYHAALVGGALEPLYLPAAGERPAEIRYRHDYAQSALHELAHWCIAGRARRTLTDYGYWYQPPPRDAAARRRFFAVETRVQGLELLLAVVADVRFHVSVDDPGTDPGDFALCVRAEANAWLRRGLPERTCAVLAALHPAWRARLGAGAAAAACGSRAPEGAAATAPVQSAGDG